METKKKNPQQGMKKKKKQKKERALVALTPSAAKIYFVLARDRALLKGAQKMLGMVEDIPYGSSLFIKGTQTPVLRLPLTLQAVTTTASTLYILVVAISASSFLNFSDLALVFSEYRVIRGELEYHAVTFIGNTTAGYVTNSFGVAVIDYVDQTVLASLDAGNAFDTKKFFGLNSYPGAFVTNGDTAATWPLQFERLPDEEWITTATTNTKFAFWKPYFPGASIVATGTAGYLAGWMDFQFRGML